MLWRPDREIAVVMSGWRRLGAVGLAVAWLVGALALPARPETVEQLRERFERTRDRLEESGAALDAVEVRVQRAHGELVVVGLRLQRARDRRERLERQLQKAISDQEAADARLQAAELRLGQATRAWQAVDASWRRHDADLRTELASVYMLGGDTPQMTGTLNALQESGNVAEFLISYEQLRSAAQQRYALVQDVDALRVRAIQRRAEVTQLRRERALAAVAAAQHRRAVAAMARHQRHVIHAIHRDRARQRALVHQLQAERRAYARRVAALQRLSDRLEQRLRRREFAAGARGRDGLGWPTDGRPTSPYGWRVHPLFGIRRLHTGVDVPAPTGQRVRAAAGGVVVRAGPFGGYGNAVVVDHGAGISTVYAHLSRVTVNAGERVGALTTIGLVGSTGHSTGPHLHFEVRRNGVPQDPMAWFD
jgi:murein DD-endopeptidase MepM/ murein hydrolase activator NlpD